MLPVVPFGCRNVDGFLHFCNFWRVCVYIYIIYVLGIKSLISLGKKSDALRPGWTSKLKGKALPFTFSLKIASKFRKTVFGEKYPAARGLLLSVSSNTLHVIVDLVSSRCGWARCQRGCECPWVSWGSWRPVCMRLRDVWGIQVGDLLQLCWECFILPGGED